jgi:gamma-glutamyltranspeptidase/glutathione hydrolase
MTSSFQSRPDLRGWFGMAASTHWLATATAQSVLERGGNAFDAAVAGAFVLHVVEPHLNGAGGDLVALIAPADDPDGPRVLMGQGPAPAGASIARYRAEGLDLVPGAGALAAAVPGAVDALLLLLRDRGTWELTRTLEYAVDLAEHGQPLVPRAAETIATVAGVFREHWPSSAALWLRDGGVPKAGAIIRNPAYAHTLRRLGEAGAGSPSRESRIDAARRAWREGFVAEAVDRFVRSPHWHSDGHDHAGVIRGEDLAVFSASYEAPVTSEFRGRTLVKAGPWSQGPALLETLNLLDGCDDEAIDPDTPTGAHTVLEAEKLALADREAFYGDRDDVPLERLLSPAYTARRRRLIGADASHELRPGLRPLAGPPLRTEYRLPPPDGVNGEPAVGEPLVSPQGETRGDTCHLDVVDRWGNMISATPSGGWLQSSPTIPELGFSLGTRLQMTWLDPGLPSSLEPGRRPRTTLTPTLVLRDGRATAALGSPGGDQQDQWQLLLLLRTIVFGRSPQQAIDAPAFHTTSVPSSFWPRTWTPGGAVVEDRFGEPFLRELRRRGHEVHVVDPWSLGRLSIVTRDPGTGLLGAAANPRGAQAYAAGR